MKKHMSAVVILCVFFSACIASDGSERQSIPQPLLDEQPGYDMQAEYARSSGFVCKHNSVYYYITLTHWIYYYDDISKVGGKLCAKPECTHETGSCNAYAHGIGGVQVYDEMLYFTDGLGSLCRMDLTGTQRETVMSLRPLDGVNPRWAIHRGYVYSSVIKNTVSEGESCDIYSLYRQKLKSTKEEKELILEQKYKPGSINEFWLIQGNRLYLSLDENERTYRNFYSFDIESGILETLFSGPSEGYVADFRADETGLDILEKTGKRVRLLRYDFTHRTLSELSQRTDAGEYMGLMSADRQRILFYMLFTEKGADGEEACQYKILDREEKDLSIGSISGKAWVLNGYGGDDVGFLLSRMIINKDYQEHELWRIPYDTGQAELLIQHHFDR